MRLTYPEHVKLFSTTRPSHYFQGLHGEQFQVSILADDLVRVQHLPDGRPRLNRTWMVTGRDGDVPREGRHRDDLSIFPLPPFYTKNSETEVKIETRALHLDITLGNFGIQWSDTGGNMFAADLAGHAYAYDRAGRTVYHSMEHHPGEHYYGFGERSGELDKAGRRMRMLNLDCLGYDAARTDPLYKHFPFYITFIPDLQIAYGLFYDNLATTTFEMGGELDAYRGQYRYYQAEDGDVDYYFIYGPSIPEVVEKFSSLTGRMLLPPRWSLGYLGSTMTYTEAPNAQEQLKRFVELCEDHRIPCDLFHLSSGYTLDTNEKRNVFTWNRDRIPDPRAMTDHFHDAGIRLAANIKPCLLTSHPRYGEVAARGGFIKQAESNTPEVSAFWGGLGSYIDFTNPAGYEWWKENVREQLLDWGIDATWNDNNEFEVWDDAARCDGFGEPMPISVARPLQTLLMVRASYEAQREYRPDQRPYLISRSGCPGIQRYAQTWSGDNGASWETLRYNIPMGLGLSLCGAPNTGHDVGGFTGWAPSPELFVRWVQNGIFHPRFTIHSWHYDGTVNEPWMYPDVLPIIRETIEFRYRLIPYLYSLLFEAAETGHPIIRPMVYAFPQDLRCHTESFDFMLGPHLLVTSVLEDGARSRPVYLPQTVEWCNFHTGEWHPGGQVVQAEAPLDRIPLFVTAGGMIPMGKVMRHIGAEPDDMRQVLVFPHPERGEGYFELVEDDGVTLGYTRGEYTKVRLEVGSTRHDVTCRAYAIGTYPLPYTTIEFILPSGDTRPVQGDTIVRRWTDAEAKQHVVISLS